mmetsp:Transcript_149821/g.264430  ORF Transcript_149821/g.264430 Transcript_149821/m.264430 type:complete len:430 (+) Transcript_149821:2-1291(+)
MLAVWTAWVAVLGSMPDWASMITEHQQKHFRELAVGYLGQWRQVARDRRDRMLANLKAYRHCVRHLTSGPFQSWYLFCISHRKRMRHLANLLMQTMRTAPLRWALKEWLCRSEIGHTKDAARRVWEVLHSTRLAERYVDRVQDTPNVAELHLQDLTGHRAGLPFRDYGQVDSQQLRSADGCDCARCSQRDECALLDRNCSDDAVCNWSDASARVLSPMVARPGPLPAFEQGVLHAWLPGSPHRAERDHCLLETPSFRHTEAFEQLVCATSSSSTTTSPRCTQNATQTCLSEPISAVARRALSTSPCRATPRTPPPAPHMPRPKPPLPPHPAAMAGPCLAARQSATSIEATGMLPLDWPDYLKGTAGEHGYFSPPRRDRKLDSPRRIGGRATPRSGRSTPTDTRLARSGGALTSSSRARSTSCEQRRAWR